MLHMLVSQRQYAAFFKSTLGVAAQMHTHIHSHLNCVSYELLVISAFTMERQIQTFLLLIFIHSKTDDRIDNLQDDVW